MLLNKIKIITEITKITKVNINVRPYTPGSKTLVERVIPKIPVTNNVLMRPTWPGNRLQRLNVPDTRTLVNSYNLVRRTSQHKDRFNNTENFLGLFRKRIFYGKEKEQEKTQEKKQEHYTHVIYENAEKKNERLLQELSKIEHDLKIENYAPKHLENYLKFLTENPHLRFNVDYHNIIMPFFNHLKHDAWSVETKNILVSLFDKYLEDKRTNYVKKIQENKLIIPENETLKEKEIREFLTKNITPRCFMEQDFDDNINIMNKGLGILEQYKNDLTDQEFINILVHLKVCNYAHVYDIETDVFENKNYNTFYYAGDLKIDRAAFKYYEICLPNISTDIISEEDFKLIMQKVTNMDFEIGNLNVNRELPPDALIVSAQDLHLNLSVSVNNIRYLLGFFTSTIDDQTLMLSQLQEINDNPKEQNKLQMFRPGIRLIKIAEETFVVNEKATAYAKDINRDPTVVQQEGKVFAHILNAIKKQEPNLKNNSIGIPIVFTKTHLVEITKKLVADSIKKDQNERQLIENNFNNLSETSLNKKKDSFQKQKKKFLKEQQEIEFRRSLSQFDRAIYDALEIVKTKKSNKNIVKTPSELFFPQKSKNTSQNNDNII